MDADTTDITLEDIRFLFRDLSSEVKIIRCWEREEVHHIIDEDPETVQLSSETNLRGRKYVATFNRRLLTRLSPYFRALLEGGFSESTEKVLPIGCREDRLRTFEQWVCTGELKPPVLSLYEGVWLYWFADFYDIPALRRTAMSKLVECEFQPWQFSPVDSVVQLSPSSPLYRFFVETYVRHARCHLPVESHETKEFLDLIYSGIANRPYNKPCRCCHNPCDYHEHDSEEEWEKTCHVTNPNFSKPDPSTYRKLPLGRQR